MLPAVTQCSVPNFQECVILGMSFSLSKTLCFAMNKMEFVLVVLQCVWTS